MKILSDNYLVKAYRNYSLRKNTPPILRKLYVSRTGSLSELERLYGRNNVRKQMYLDNLREKGSDFWELTREGEGYIEDFYKKQSIYQAVKSILFGMISKPFY